ncbi:hypothetical protein PR003_g35083, partial [Phytophthora rubi]
RTNRKAPRSTAGAAIRLRLAELARLMENPYDAPNPISPKPGDGRVAAPKPGDARVAAPGPHDRAAAAKSGDAYAAAELGEAQAANADEA